MTEAQIAPRARRIVLVAELGLLHATQYQAGLLGWPDAPAIVRQCATEAAMIANAIRGLEEAITSYP